MRHLKLIIPILIILLSCKKDHDHSDPAPTPDPKIKFKPTDVLVGAKGTCSIDSIFDFINLFDHEVQYIRTECYSSLPSDSLSYVKHYIAANAWSATAVLDDKTGIITVYSELHDMKDQARQAAWLNAMNVLQLKESTEVKVILFHVPEGKELEWVNQFKSHECVQWAELNKIFVTF
jgi:hypothetical protein